jgi:hypothetical protein
MKHRVALDYELAEGWLAPWVEGLRKGEAVASHCTACHSSRFPPLRACPVCRARLNRWVTLSGYATVLSRTTGTDGDFVMARFDGTEGGAILRADHLPDGAERGRLRACGADDPPTLSLAAITIDEPTP